jgi:hypothetical protein
MSITRYMLSVINNLLFTSDQNNHINSYICSSEMAEYAQFVTDPMGVITNSMEQSCMEPKDLLPCLQRHTTGPYPELDESISHPHTLIH